MTLDSLIHDVAVNLVSGVISGVISAAATYAFLWARGRRRAQALWRLHDPSSLTVVVSTSNTLRDGPPGSRPGTGVGQLRAISLLAPSLVSGYRSSVISDGKILLSSEARASHLSGDLILLGGPRTNEITRQVFESHPMPVYMRDAHRDDGSGDRDSRVHWAPPGRPVKILPTAEEGDFVYGLILRHPNVFDPDSRNWMWILAGTSTFGTQAAAEWLNKHQRKIREIKGIASFVVRARQVGNPVHGISPAEQVYPRQRDR